jgi:CBS domain-containing protein
MIEDFAPGDDNVFDPEASASVAFDAERGTRLPFIHSPLSEMLEREPISCQPEAPVRSALEAMNRHRIGSMIVVDGNARPIGILTLPDVLSRVALPGCNLDDPISAVMTSGVTTLPPDATLYDAALTMIRRGIRHVIVVNDGRLAGVVTQSDLFHPQRIGAHRLSAQIRTAQDLDELKHCSAEVRTRAHDMLVQGTSIERLTRFLTSLNDLLTQRTIDLVFADHDLRDIEWCWISLGSEGRLEQTFCTEQDNALVFAPPTGMDAEDARNTLLPLARRVNHALAGCGFTLCRGNIMSGNPACCLTLDEWRRRFGQWLNANDPEALLNGSIFFDLRPLYGEASLVGALKDWLLEATRANGRFLHQMAANALRNLPPLGHIRDFVLDGEGDDAHTLDVKVHGTALFVDAARIFGLAAGIGETSTLERLRRAGPLVDVPGAEVEVWVDSFLVLQRLRLEHQHLQHVAGKAMTNRLDPYRLHELDRLMLKESLRQAKKAQSRLALDYRL